MKKLLPLFHKRFELVKDNKKKYSHFDSPIDIKKRKPRIKKEFLDPIHIKNHHFYPLITYYKKKIKIKYISGKKVIESWKQRMISYSSHYDSLVLSWYAFILQERYLKYANDKGFLSSSIAYRKVNIKDDFSWVNRWASNIDLSNYVFDFILNKWECVALAFDIKGFFDNLDWEILKFKWQDVLWEWVLPQDHYHIFKSLTRFSYIEKDVILKELWLKNNSIDQRNAKMKGYISWHDRRLTIRNKFMRKKLLKINPNLNHKKWIPQGSAISAILSNIYMIDFDFELHNLANEYGALYRRYCDDLMIVCSIEHKDLFLEKVSTLIEKDLKLTIQAEKVDRTIFKNNINGKLRWYYDMDDVRNIERNSKVRYLCSLKRRGNILCMEDWCDFNSRCTTIEKKLQYLWLLFDWEECEIRAGSMQNYHNKITNSKNYNFNLLLKNKSLSKSDIKKSVRKILIEKLSKPNFITYLDRAYKITNSKRILHQKKKARCAYTKL